MDCCRLSFYADTRHDVVPEPVEHDMSVHGRTDSDDGFLRQDVVMEPVEHDLSVHGRTDSDDGFFVHDDRI